MKKNKFYPLAGTAVFLVDQWIKDYVEKKISNELEKIMNERKIALLNESGKIIPLYDDEEAQDKYTSEVVAPIIAEGDAIGSVIIATKENGTKFGELEMKLAETAAAFLGKQMEQ